MWRRIVMLTTMLLSCRVSCSFGKLRVGSRSLGTALSGAGFDTYMDYHHPPGKSSAYVAAKDAFPAAPTIILVNPHVDQNVGSVARTMLNFGLTDLVIVDPACDILSGNAQALAAGGFEIIENAKVCSTLSEAVAGLHRVFATTIRPRHMTQVVCTPRKAAEEAIAFEGKVGILFGRESSGLSNDEIAVADTILTVSTLPNFSSLNLAQAVNLVAYELWQANLHLNQSFRSPPEQLLRPKDRKPLANRDDVDIFIRRLETCLEEREYQLNEVRRVQSFREIRSLFNRIQLTKGEVDIVHGVLSALIRPKEFFQKDCDAKDLDDGSASTQ